MKTLARTDNLSREQFTALHERLDATGISGSNIAKILNRHPKEDSFTFFYQCKGRVEKPDLLDVERVEWGRLLEPVIAVRFEAETGLHVEPIHAILGHDTEEWMFGTPDGKIAGKDEGFEAKLVGPSPYFAGWWDEGPPEYVKAQCYQYLEITNWERWHVAACFCGILLGTWVIERNQKIQDWIIRAGREFMRRLREDDPPPVDESESCTETLKKLYPGRGENESVIALPEEAEDLMICYLGASAKIKEHKGNQRLQRNRLLVMLENHDAGRCGNYRVTKRPFKVKRLEEDE